MKTSQPAYIYKKIWPSVRTILKKLLAPKNGTHIDVQNSLEYYECIPVPLFLHPHRPSKSSRTTYKLLQLPRIPKERDSLPLIVLPEAFVLSNIDYKTSPPDTASSPDDLRVLSDFLDLVLGPYEAVGALDAEEEANEEEEDFDGDDQRWRDDQTQAE